MSTQAPSNEPSTPSTPQPTGLADPNISFSEYEKLRRSGASSAESATPSAPGSEKSKEQKEATESDPEAKRAKEVDDEGELDSDRETDADESEEGKQAKSKKQSGGWQRRIDKKTREAAEARREAEFWKAQALKSAAAPEGAKPSQETATAPKPAESTGEPNPDDFQTHAEYVRALTKWTTKQELEAKERAQKELEVKNQRSTVERTFAERSKAFAEKTKDYHSVIANGQEDGLFISEAMHSVILESDHGPALFYELAKNPEESQRIGQLPPHRQLMEMGKLESRILASASSPEPKEQETKITKAPKPPEPVTGGKGAAPARSIHDPDLPFSDYVRMRREQMRRRRG